MPPRSQTDCGAAFSCLVNSFHKDSVLISFNENPGETGRKCRGNGEFG